MTATRSLRPGDRVLTWGEFPHRKRAAYNLPNGYPGGVTFLEVKYTVPAEGRTKYDRAQRDVYFTDGSSAKSLTNAEWILE